MAATAKAMAARGIDVVDFSSGEPDFDTPEPVKAAAEAAIRAGFTKYTPSSGIDELRQAIIDTLQAEQGLRYEKSRAGPCGAKHSLYNQAALLKRATKSSFRSLLGLLCRPNPAERRHADFPANP
jgi:aspartate aminotransferase